MDSSRIAAWAAGIVIFFGVDSIVLAAPPADWSGIPRAPARQLRSSSTGSPANRSSVVPAQAIADAPESDDAIESAVRPTRETSQEPSVNSPRQAPAKRVPPSKRPIQPSAQPNEVGTGTQESRPVQSVGYHQQEAEVLPPQKRMAPSVMPEGEGTIIYSNPPPGVTTQPFESEVSVGNDGVWIGGSPHSGPRGGCSTCGAGGGCASGHCSQGACGAACGRPGCGPFSGCGPLSCLLGRRFCEDNGGECGGCDGCNECGNDRFLNRCGGFTFDVRYLHWWTDDAITPALVTRSTNTTRGAQTAALGEAATTVLVGGASLADNDRNGVQGTLAWWMHDCSALEISYFSFGSSTVQATGANSNTTTVLGVPFFDTSVDAENALLIAFPNFASGSFDVAYRSEFQGASVGLRKVLVRDCNRRWDLMFGYRTASLDENLRLQTNILGGAQSAQQNTRVVQVDEFDIDNEFHGADLGVAGNWRYCNWTLSAMGKVAVGNSRSLVTINGATTQTSPTGGVTSGTGGVFALNSNIGRFDSNELSMMPELGATLGWETVCGIRATVGYSMLYWSRVGRPGDQIDRDLHPDLFFPAVAVEERPEFTFRPNHFWAQGVNVGFEFNF